MSLLLAVVCHDASISESGNLSCDTIFRNISAGSFPHVHPRMVLACSFEINLANHLERTHIWADLIDADGHLLAQVVDYSCLMVGMRGNPNAYSFTVEMLNLIFPSPGDYRFSIFVDGAVAAELSLTLGLMS